jgi:glycosidase
MKKLLALLLAILFLDSCQKDVNNPPVNPPGSDSTSFSVPSTEDIIMYEVNLRAFSPAGDLPGIIDRLDEIKALSVNVIWLMPIFPIGQLNTVNSPYCVKNYTEVNPELGTLNDLKTLVKEAHKRDIAVILDWVANHTAWDNPWITNKDWYTQDGNGNIVHPPGTNWQDVADLDFDNQEMRLNMIKAMEYWVKTAGIDGFRCDAADMVPFGFWEQAIDSVSNVNDSLIWLAEGARADHFDAGFRMNYSWDFYNKLKNVFAGVQPAASLVLVNNQEYLSIPPGCHKLRFTTNHDESAWDATPMVLFNGERGAMAASVAAVFIGGVPMIYGSQEVGTTENVPFFSNSPIDWTQNPEMLQEYKDIMKAYTALGHLKTGELSNYSTYDVLCFRRSVLPGEYLVIENLRNNSITYIVPAALANTTWIDMMNGTNYTLPVSLELSPYQYLILGDVISF